MDIPSSYARSYRIVLPNSQGTISPRKISISSYISDSNLSAPSGRIPIDPYTPLALQLHNHQFNNLNNNNSPHDTSPRSSSPRSTPPSRKLSDREPLPFPPPSFPRIPSVATSPANHHDGDDDDEHSKTSEDNSFRISSSPSLTTNRHTQPSNTNNTGSLGFLSPLGNDTSTVISAADSALDLHAEIANAVQRAVAAHNSSWQATLAAAENEWIKNKDDAIQRLTHIKDDHFNKEKTRWDNEKKELIHNYETQIKQLQTQLQRADIERNEEASKTSTLANTVERLRAESIPLSSHKAEILALELQLKAREKSTEDAVKAMRATQDQAIGRATVLVRMSEDRLMVAIAAREAELKETLEKMRNEYNDEVETLKQNHEEEIKNLEQKLRAEALEALTAEQTAHATTKSALARMRGKATMVRALAHVHSAVGNKSTTPPITTSSSPLPFLPSPSSNTSPSQFTNSAMKNNLASPSFTSPLNTSETNSSGFFSPAGILPANLPLSSVKKGDKSETTPSITVGRIISPVDNQDDQPADGFEMLPSSKDETRMNLTSTLNQSTNNTNADLPPTVAIPHPDDHEHAEHERELDELHEKVHELGSQLAALTTEHEQLQGDHAAVQEELINTRRERNEFEDSYRDTKTKYDDAFDTLIVTKRELQEANDTVESLGETVEVLTTNVATARNENDVLHEEVLRLRPLVEKGEEDYKQAVKLREQLALVLLALATDIAVQLPSDKTTIETETKDNSTENNSSVISQGNMTIIPSANILQPLTNELKTIIKSVDKLNSTTLETNNTKLNTIKEETKIDNQPFVSITTENPNATSFTIPDNVIQYVESRLPTYPAVLAVLQELFTLSDETHINIDGILQENDTKANTFSDSEDEDEETTEPKLPSEAAKDALYFINLMFKAAETTVERNNAMKSTLSSLSGYTLSPSLKPITFGLTVSDNATNNSSSEPFAPLPIVLPEITYEPLFSNLAKYRYSGILSILSSIKSSTKDELLPAARGLLSFLAILADTTSTPKGVIEVLQYALDQIAVRDTEKQRNAVSSIIKGTATNLNSNNNELISSVIAEEMIKFDADIAEQLVATADQLRQAAVAAERRYGTALADAALIKESTSVALIRANTYIQQRDQQLQTVFEYLSSVKSQWEEYIDRLHNTETTIQAMETYVQQLQQYRKDDQHTFIHIKDEWKHQLTIYRNLLTKLQSEIDALTNFELSRAPFINRSGTNATTASSTASPRNPLQHMGAATLVMSSAHRLAQKAKSAVARKHAEAEAHAAEEKAEAEAKALAESQIKALHDALVDTPPLPMSPQPTYNMNDTTPQVPYTPSGNNTFMTPAPPTPNNFRMNNMLTSPMAPNTITNTYIDRIMAVENSIGNTANTIRLRSELLASAEASSSTTNSNPLASPAIAALSAFVNNSPRAPPAATSITHPIKLNHPLPLPILGITSPTSSNKPARAPPAIPSLASPATSTTPHDRYAGGIGTSIPYTNFGESLSSELVRKQKQHNAK